MSGLRAVVDANVWIAGALAPTGFARRVGAFATAHRFTPVSCERTLTEFKDAFVRPRIMGRYGLTLDDLNKLIRLLTTDGLVLPDPEVVPICRDPKDDVYVALSIAAAADYLVTRDDDLKGDENVRRRLSDAGVQIVTIREFVAILEVDDA